jgi:hypothetical protein
VVAGRHADTAAAFELDDLGDSVDNVIRMILE